MIAAQSAELQSVSILSKLSLGLHYILPLGVVSICMRFACDKRHLASQLDWVESIRLQESLQEGNSQNGFSAMFHFCSQGTEVTKVTGDICLPQKMTTKKKTSWLSNIV